MEKYSDVDEAVWNHFRECEIPWNRMKCPKIPLNSGCCCLSSSLIRSHIHYSSWTKRSTFERTILQHIFCDSLFAYICIFCFSFVLIISYSFPILLCPVLPHTTPAALDFHQLLSAVICFRVLSFIFMFRSRYVRVCVSMTRDDGCLAGSGWLMPFSTF